MPRLGLAFAAVIIAYDAAAAFLARLLTVGYTSLLLPGAVVLFLMGVYAGQRLKSWAALIPVASAAIVQWTVGWYVAGAIGGGVPVVWNAVAITGMVAGAFGVSIAIGAAGVWVGLGVAGARKEVL
jgi:hypothetical protein